MMILSKDTDCGATAVAVVMVVTMSHDDPLKEATGSPRYCDSQMGGREVNKSQVDAGIWLFSRRRPGTGERVLHELDCMHHSNICNVLLLFWSSDKKRNLFLKSLLLFNM